MKSAQNKMDNSSCGIGKDEMAKNSTKNSAVDSTRNQGDLREFRNEGDLRDVTDKGGNKDKFNMAYS